MSAYIVSAACMNTVVATMLPAGTDEERTALGRELFALNAAAVACRYRSPAETTHAEGYAFDAARTPANDVDRRGALSELMYQCAEGDFDTTPLFARVRAARDGAKPAPVVAPAHVGRDEALARIRAALKATGRTWSVTGGRGTARSWITVEAPPARRAEFGYTTDEDRRLLAVAFGLGYSADLRTVSCQGISISPDERGWHVAAVETHAPLLAVV